MSQPPSPYSAPQPYPQMGYAYDPAGAWLAPARRTAIGTFLVGGVVLLCGLCCAGVGVAAPEPMLVTMVEQSGASEATSGMMRAVLIFMGVVALLMGIVMFVLAAFVWRGSRFAAITSIVLTSFILLMTIINSIGSLFSPPAMKGPQILGFLIGVIILPATLGGLLLMLISALKAANAYRAAQMQYQMQYWQFQQQQAYNQAGYGYGAQPPAEGNSHGDTPRT